ncbi:hypothetical protein [Bradyrhizobium sp. STM 3562]
MMAILEQSIFDCLGAVQEYAAEKAVLFASNPVAARIFANKHG